MAVLRADPNRSAEAQDTSASTSTQPHSAQPFRFFDLPSELRLEIYEYVLDNSPICVKGVPYSVSRRTIRNALYRAEICGGFFMPHMLPLADVNTQARLELAPFLFECKIEIAVFSHTALRNLLRNLGPLGLARLGYLNISLSLSDWTITSVKKPSLPDMLRTLTGLKMARIGVHFSWEDNTHFNRASSRDRAIYAPKNFIKLTTVKELCAAGIKCELGFQYNQSSGIKERKWVEDVVSMIRHDNLAEGFREIEIFSWTHRLQSTMARL